MVFLIVLFNFRLFWCQELIKYRGSMVHLPRKRAGMNTKDIGVICICSQQIKIQSRKFAKSISTALEPMFTTVLFVSIQNC